MTNLILRVNITSTDDSYANHPENYINLDDDDYLIFSGGSDAVKDGEDLPTELELNRAATVVSAIDSVEVAKYFLADYSENLLREIINAGLVAKRYVFAASFDGATATEPTLEAWDDDDCDTYILTCLGAGTPNLSWYKAIVTTYSTPSAPWAGVSLAGSGTSNVVYLNATNGPLTVATDLYFNFAVVIPAGVSTPEANTPCLAIVYATN